MKPLRDGDRPVQTLRDAILVIDAASCIVLITPERRITVTSVDEWREQLASGRTSAQIYRDEAENLRRDENQAGSPRDKGAEIMADLTGFWATIKTQLGECEHAGSADDVILATERNPYDDPTITGAPAFFAGSGGDDSLMEALRTAGWTVTWAEAPYHYKMQAPDGSAITYVEGDIFPTCKNCGCDHS